MGLKAPVELDVKDFEDETLLRSKKHEEVVLELFSSIGKSTSSVRCFERPENLESWVPINEVMLAASNAVVYELKQLGLIAKLREETIYPKVEPLTSPDDIYPEGNVFTVFELADKQKALKHLEAKLQEIYRDRRAYFRGKLQREKIVYRIELRKNGEIVLHERGRKPKILKKTQAGSKPGALIQYLYDHPFEEHKMTGLNKLASRGLRRTLSTLGFNKKYGELFFPIRKKSAVYFRPIVTELDLLSE